MALTLLCKKNIFNFYYKKDFNKIKKRINDE